MSVNLKKETNKKPVKPPQERLNLKNLPQSVSGYPEEIFIEHDLVIVITGVNELNLQLRKKTIDGSLGKIIPVTEAVKLSKAAGFVRANSKDESKNELILKSRLLFYNSDSEVKMVKDPKAFSKLVEDIDNNLNKALAAIERAGDSDEDKAASHIFKELHYRATEGAQAWINMTLQGETEKLDHYLSKASFPLSMKSKFLTGAFEVPAQSKFWTSFYGKEMHRFCNLTITEVKEFSKESLNLFYSTEQIKELEQLCQDEKLASYVGYDDIKKVPARILEKMKEYSFPVHLPLSNVEMLRRYADTRSVIKTKNLGESLWPPLDMHFNALTASLYLRPPPAVADVKNFWENLSQGELIDPNISGKSYREQVILDMTLVKPRVLPKLPDKPALILSVKGIAVRNLFLSNFVHSDAAGNAVSVNKQKFDRFLPIEIVGPPKATKKKDRDQQASRQHTPLTKKSLSYLRGLKAQDVSSNVIDDVADYLKTFMFEDFQSMAAKIVYATCNLSAGSNVLQRMLYEEETPNPFMTPIAPDGNDKDNSDDDDDIDDDLPVPIADTEK